jgi:hypothetical protein
MKLLDLIHDAYTQTQKLMLRIPDGCTRYPLLLTIDDLQTLVNEMMDAFMMNDKQKTSLLYPLSPATTVPHLIDDMLPLLPEWHGILYGTVDVFSSARIPSSRLYVQYTHPLVMPGRQPYLLIVPVFPYTSRDSPHFGSFLSRPVSRK